MSSAPANPLLTAPRLPDTVTANAGAKRNRIHLSKPVQQVHKCSSSGPVRRTILPSAQAPMSAGTAAPSASRDPDETPPLPDGYTLRKLEAEDFHKGVQ